MEAPTFLLLVLCVGVAASSAVDLHKRIYGGKECDPTERLYHVALAKDPKGEKIICGGSLISDQWVLTAAHCKIDKMYAVPGVHPGPGNTVEIKRKPKIFHKFLFFQKHDIMLLKLPDPVTNIVPIDLPTKGNCNKPPIGETVNIAGHGTYKVDVNGFKVRVASDKLRCVDMHVVDCNLGGEKCLGVDPQYLFCGGDKQDKKDGKDVGIGDSGGGVIYNNKIYGIVMGDDEKPCIVPAVFVDVCPHLKWILKTIKN